jgi:hypothetical protein
MDLSFDNVNRAFGAAQRASKLIRDVSAQSVNRAQLDLIDATLLRFAAEPREMAVGPAREKLNLQYADAMEQLAIKHQSEDWILFFAADAEMNTAPWNYWEEILPAGTGTTLRARLQKAEEYVATVLQREPQHAGALHLQIHLFEAARDISRALRAGEALEKIDVKGAEHLLHMPSHAFLRAGMFERSIRANERATAARFADEAAYPQHNIEFMM